MIRFTSIEDGLPEHVPVYGIKRHFQIHKFNMQWLLELCGFRQQTQCQDCIQCGTTTGKRIGDADDASEAGGQVWRGGHLQILCLGLTEE